MRFPHKFTRQKGSASTDPALGSDAVPTTAPAVTSNGTILTCKLRDVNGWPVQRIAVCWTTAASNPTPLLGDLYFWEAETSAWHRSNLATQVLPPNQLCFFDTATIIEPTPVTTTLAKPGAPAQAGCMSVALVVRDPGAQVNGVFSIAIGGDMTAESVSAEHPSTLYSVLATSAAGAAVSGPGSIRSAQVINRSTSSVYFQLFDKASAPTSGNVPKIQFVVPPGVSTFPSMIQLGNDFFLAGVPFTTGIAYGLSSATGSYTAVVDPTDFDVAFIY